ncbi:MAG TPA: Rid family detoxifying hydrolase [Acidimicrobiales bacterium]|jgi:2-iminobutanoate/2-iminopropanoate deaminase|nr:Rid family detoxifying hydrolase [Acidimicrobiales bacterium]
MSDTPAKPVGPYTPAVRAGDWLICSGQVALKNGALLDGGVAEQTAQCVANVKALVESHGCRLDQVVKTTVFMTDIADYAEMNSAYVEAFGDHRPARSAVAVAGLPLGARVEIEAWVHTA